MPMMRQTSQKSVGSTQRAQQRGLIFVAVAGFVGVIFLNQAVSSNVQKPTTSPTPMPVASTSVAVGPVTPAPTPKPYQRYANNPQLASQRVAQIARETKGDWNKVSWDDQVMINRMTQGHGAEMLRSIAQRQAASQKVTSPSASAPSKEKAKAP